MNEVATISAEARERVGKSGTRSLRRGGRVPAVIYGGEGQAVHISVDLREISHEIHRPGFFSRIYDVKLNGESQRVLPRDVQFHPVTDQPLHVDFLRYVAGQRIRVNISVSFADHELSPGLKRGGVLNIVRHEIEFFCPAEAIPEEIPISLSDLEIGDSVHIKDIALPEGVSPTITDRDFTIATIAAPTVKKEEDRLAAEEAAAAALAAELEGEEGEEAEAEAEGEAEGKAEGEAPKEGEQKPGGKAKE